MKTEKDDEKIFSRRRKELLHQLVFTIHSAGRDCGDVKEDDIMKKLDFLSKWQGKEVKMPEVAGFCASKHPIYLWLTSPAAANPSSWWVTRNELRRYR